MNSLGTVMSCVLGITILALAEFGFILYAYVNPNAYGLKALIVVGICVAIGTIVTLTACWYDKITEEVQVLDYTRKE